MKQSFSRWLCLAVVLAIGSSGCSRSDAETWAGIGRKVAERTQFISDGVEQTWTRCTGRATLENRVKNRLCWDKSLAETTIEVQVADKTVELKGNVATHEQARRAQELAESTLGVEKVVNSLLLTPVASDAPQATPTENRVR